MKLIPFAVVVILVLFITAPDESEAVPIAWFLRIAAVLGMKALRKGWYARCNTRYVPAGITCPSVVYGFGFSRQQAQAAARLFAGKKCAKYVGHCQIHKLLKKGKRSTAQD